jgi:uncharacterized phage-like protein YoqJ
MITLINTAVLFVVIGCNISPKPSNLMQSNFGNSQDEECKKIIKVINRSNTLINTHYLLPPLTKNRPIIELPTENLSKDKLPKPQRFNSRRATGKTTQELQKETYEKAQQEQTRQWDEQAKQWDEQEKQKNNQLLEKLDSRIKDVEAVELSDSQLKNLQTQLVQAYRQERQANNAMFSTLTPYRNSSSLEQSADSSLKKLEEDLQKIQQQADKQIQQMNDASSKIQIANSDLNKYCGLE